MSDRPGYWVAMRSGDKPQLTIDKHFTLKCPHCGAKSNLTAISIPRWEQVDRYRPEELIVGYRCDACNGSVALRFRAFLDFPNGEFHLSNTYTELEPLMERFDYEHLPEVVAKDFREALTCYSHSCPNGTAAMCRRTIQTVAMNLGATGTSKVQAQILEAKQTAGMDDDTFEALVRLP